jgi:cell division protein FtsZ
MVIGMATRRSAFPAVQQVASVNLSSSGASCRYQSTLTDEQREKATAFLKKKPEQTVKETPEAVIPEAKSIEFNETLIKPEEPKDHIDKDLLHKFAPKIMVVGVGGAGGNALNNMVSKQLKGVDFAALNTDAQHLATNKATNKVQLGAELTQGLGCGANPDAGRMAAEESREEIKKAVKDAHLVFITAGMGGGTGTGAAPVIADICYEMGIMTIGVVTMPFNFEGTHRRRLAMEGVERLQDVVDTLIVIPNQNLFEIAGPETTFVDAFQMADDVLLGGVKTITDLMTSPGIINLDFADVQAVMADMGNAIMGTGLSNAGEDRAVKAAEQALGNPLLGDSLDISSAKGVLVNITGGKDMTLYEVDKAAQLITKKVIDESANIIFGSTFDPSLEGSIRVSVVATGIDKANV